MVCLYCIIDIFGIKWGENMRLKGFDGQRNICGPKIKEERMKQKMTQTQLSELLKAYRIDLNQKVLSQIELQKRHVTEYEFVAIARPRPRDWISARLAGKSARFSRSRLGLCIAVLWIKKKIIHKEQRVST